MWSQTGAGLPCGFSSTPAADFEGQWEGPWLACPVCTAPPLWGRVAEDGIKVYVDIKAQHIQPLWGLALA